MSSGCATKRGGPDQRLNLGIDQGGNFQRRLTHWGSLRRGLEAPSVAAAVAKDPMVERAKAEPGQYLTHAYRDPQAAQVRLTDLVKGQGWAGAAFSIADDPSRLARLRGRDGLFADRFAQLDRARAISATSSISRSWTLTRIAEAERRAERGYRDSVVAQRARDAVGVPRLSAKAGVALNASCPRARPRQATSGCARPCAISRP